MPNPRSRRSSTSLIEHHMLVLDANLSACLDDSQRQQVTSEVVHELLSRLGMEELGPLEVYPAVDPKAPGWSFIQPITTSHISGHYFAIEGQPPHVHVDIYSCRRFDRTKVLDVLNSHLGLADWVATFLLRDLHLQSRVTIELRGRGPNIDQESVLFPLSEQKPSV